MIDVPRVETLDTDVAPAWCSMPGNVQAALVRCANRHWMGIGAKATHPSGHVIHDDGRVTASILCPVEGCGWHVFARLVGWPP